MSESTDSCPFCGKLNHTIVRENEHATAFRDAFPVSYGHTLIVPRRHVADLFDLSERELADAIGLVRQTKAQLLVEFSPSGFNVGVNIGRDAGQTVMHAHIHVIPRYAGDVADPTGGIRNVIPDKGRYSLDVTRSTSRNSVVANQAAPK